MDIRLKTYKINKKEILNGPDISCYALRRRLLVREISWDKYIDRGQIQKLKDHISSSRHFTKTRWRTVH